MDVNERRIARLHRRRERSRERRAAESYELREARLASRRARPRERHTAESSEQRETQLERHWERDGVAHVTAWCRLYIVIILSSYLIYDAECCPVCLCKIVEFIQIWCVICRVIMRKSFDLCVLGGRGCRPSPNGLKNVFLRKEHMLFLQSCVVEKNTCIINPQHACTARVNVVVLCLSVTTLAKTSLVFIL